MEIVQLLIIAALLVWVIGKRLAGQPLTANRMLVIPVVMIGYGLFQATRTHLTGGDVALLVAESVIGIAFGLVRGLTIRVYERGGHLWYRYSPVTVALWVLAIAARIGVAVVAHRMGASLPGTSVVAALGVSLLGEAAVVLPRAHRTGVPFAPDRRTARVSAGRDR